MRSVLVFFFLVAATVATSAAACVTPKPNERAEIYPTAEQLPANLLRFFVYFPRPMGRVDVLDDIALIDETGAEVNGAFLSNRYHLWSPDTTRLTILLDPGRVKTGLAAHNAMGRALEEGQQYSLVVPAFIQDIQGCALGAETVHSFLAGPPDLEPPLPNQWVLVRPSAGSQEPLIVDLGSPHDHLSLVYRLRVMNEEGALVAGRVALRAGETEWHFTPRTPWSNAAYTLAVDPALEDLAGNRPGTLFDQPIGENNMNWARARNWKPVVPQP